MKLCVVRLVAPDITQWIASTWTSLVRSPNDKHTGDFLRIERSPVDVGGGDPSDHGGHALGSGEAMAEQKAGDPTSTPGARHTTDSVNPPWRLVMDPCGQRSVKFGADGGGSGADGHGTEQGMVLYNVAAGALLHVR